MAYLDLSLGLPVILRLPSCSWAKWQVLWDLTEIKSQLLASKCYYERETVVQVAAWVSLLFSLVHPHLVLDAALLGWVPAQAILVLHAGLAELLLCIGSSHTQSCSQRTSNLLKPAVLHKSQTPGVDQIVGKCPFSCKGLKHLETFPYHHASVMGS